jgi:hypothetical protein
LVGHRLLTQYFLAAWKLDPHTYFLPTCIPCCTPNQGDELRGREGQPFYFLCANRVPLTIPVYPLTDQMVYVADLAAGELETGELGNANTGAAETGSDEKGSIEASPVQS